MSTQSQTFFFGDSHTTVSLSKETFADEGWRLILDARYVGGWMRMGDIVSLNASTLNCVGGL